MTPAADLITPLRRYWGYSSFRPLQERIVQSLLAGHDICVVMPTGGGKSLCYQLPAVISGRTAVVISPLIALMQDQAAQLEQAGIPAAVLNSSISSADQSRIMRQAREGAYRLLYLSPERLQRGDTTAWLQQVPISFFAIDEAHCISEWGHEFRPEYRQLRQLRERFPDRAIAAFTASATRHVRHDILTQLALRNPDKYIASFHRPNLRYIVQESKTSEQSSLLVTSLRHHEEGNVIVYCPTINKVEETVERLGNQGISALPYHSQMQADDRRRNQERWMSDEVPVIVGTIAFGLGINKATVRAVIHLALPKSLEQYYQEAGRGGRDGKPADCILLWRKQDAGLLGYFANKILDAGERERAWQRYHTIRAFAESFECRHRQICTHFGETPKWQTCGACDVCGAKPDWLTAAGRSAVRRAFVGSRSSTANLDSGIDAGLREYLREWRRAAAKHANVPAYVVLHDTSLDEICRLERASLRNLRMITGIGERKVATYGKQILEAIDRYRQGARAALPEKKTAPKLETLQLLQAGRTFAEIATIRGRRLATVIDTVAGLVERGELEFSAAWIDPSKLSVIEAACRRVDPQIERLKPLKDALPPDVTYDEIRLVLARNRREQNRKAETRA